jgi:hypothetical protein
MMSEYAGKRPGAGTVGHTTADPQAATPGKYTLVEQTFGASVQRRVGPGAPVEQAAVGDAASPGAPAGLARAPLGATIQRVFGHRAPTAAPAADGVVQRAQPSGAEQASGGAQARPNRTGLPDGLKAGIESLSGVSMDAVRVHHNSSKPAEVNALAYAQGSDIHLGPGQERHLPHEAWHVVQQAQGRVRPTMQMKDGIQVNDDHGLEHEADVMGERAARMAEHPAPASELASTSPAGPAQLRLDGEVMQRALAAVNPQNGPIALHQAGGGVGAFMVMQNPGQPAGEEPKNTVGFTGVMNGDEWGGLGKTSTEYWRAHAYANSFGGAGDITNVGWWKADAEAKWTEHEQHVRGAGQDEIPAWRPGTGEQGTYLVAREMHKQIALMDRYITGLMAAVNWAFADERDAWQRALATCNSHNQKDKEKRIAALKAGRETVKNNNQTRIQTWVNELFGGGSVETNLIKKMTMTYTITTVGANPGASRAGVTKSVSSAEPKPVDFGLKNEPEQIWTEMVNHNTGVFARGNAPASLMTAAVPYDEPRKPAQQLRAYVDGFGVA